MEIDSKSVTDLMTRQLDEDEDLLTLVCDCRVLATYFACIKFRHVFCEGNKYTDALANIGQEGDWRTSLLEDPRKSSPTSSWRTQGERLLAKSANLRS